MFFLAVVSYRNSTSNHNCLTWYIAYRRLYLIEILHQTTTDLRLWTKIQSCILSKFYIKPQLKTMSPRPLTVVSYRNSTSNHNLWREFVNCRRLYLIEILHQTTTLALISSFSTSCILSKFYIKPQLKVATLKAGRGCILSKFYIKPQLFDVVYRLPEVVSYRNSTSNHNRSSLVDENSELYLIEILHQTTTKNDVSKATHGCILSKFYIKPQPLARVRELPKVVSYRNSTSNHNSGFDIEFFDKLYLIEILHQTTTRLPLPGVPPCCILSKFYIKPQHLL